MASCFLKTDQHAPSHLCNQKSRYSHSSIQYHIYLTVACLFIFFNIWQFINQWNILSNKLLHLSGRKNTKFENTSPTEFEHNTSTQLRETFVQFRSLFLHPSGHEFIGNGLQQFGFLSIGPHEVCFSGWNRLVFQLNSSPFLFGFLLFLIIFLHTFQESILAN